MDSILNIESENFSKFFYFIFSSYGLRTLDFMHSLLAHPRGEYVADIIFLRVSEVSFSNFYFILSNIISFYFIFWILFIYYFTLFWLFVLKWFNNKRGQFSFDNLLISWFLKETILVATTWWFHFFKKNLNIFFLNNKQRDNLDVTPCWSL